VTPRVSSALGQHDPAIPYPRRQHDPFRDPRVVLKGIKGIKMRFLVVAAGGVEPPTSRS